MLLRESYLMSRNDKDVRAFKVKHSFNVVHLLAMFRLLLQKAVDMIWENVEWKQEIVEDSYIIRFSGKDYKKKLESTIKCLEIQGKSLLFMRMQRERVV